MKKIIILLMVVLAAYQHSSGQTPSPAKVSIGMSYKTTGYVNVHPYLSGTDPASDDKYYFKLNIGTKFKINEVLSGNDGSTTGYVISPWSFTDNTAKKNFYTKILKAGGIKRHMQLLKDSIIATKAAYQLVQAKITADSLSQAENKAKYDSVRQLAKERQHQVFNAAVGISVNKVMIKKAKKDAGLKKQVRQFTTIQGLLKSELQSGQEPDSTAKQQLIDVAKSLPTTDAARLKQYSRESISYQNNLRAADQDYRATFEQLTDSRTDLAKRQTELTRLTAKIHSAALQPNPNTPDPNAYKATKASKNYPIDNPTDTTDQASKYDELAYLDSWANGWLFFISSKDFSDYAVLVYPTSDKFTWGFLTLPVKMRFDNSKAGRFDFEQNLSFGLTFGDKHQFVSTSDVSLNTLLGLAVVNVPLNDATTTSTTAVSTSVGVMLQYDKFQMGVFVGTDYAGSHANQFAYQGKPWLGFAIGVSLFGESQTTATPQSQASGKP